MARTAASNGLSIAKLENLLRERRDALNDLRKQRTRLEKELADADRKIAALEGGKVRAGGRARNSQSLVSVLEAVLSESGKPMKVGDIVDAVEAKGYHSSSSNFRGIVNQTLIKEKKRFAAAARGTYQLKK